MVSTTELLAPFGFGLQINFGKPSTIPFELSHLRSPAFDHGFDRPEGAVLDQQGSEFLFLVQQILRQGPVLDIEKEGGRERERESERERERERESQR